MAIESFKKEIDSSDGAFAKYTIFDNGSAAYDDSVGRHYEAFIDVDVICLFCEFGKMSVATQDKVISLMKAV